MTENKLKVELKVEAVISENKLHVRMAGPIAELADGRRVEVATSLNGMHVSVMVTATDRTWRTYHLSAEALGQAVLAHNDAMLLERLHAAFDSYELKLGECICWKCLEGKNVTMMVVCPTCGNKRCPKASDHELACTNSNEPGQPGSVYGTIAPDEQLPET